MRSDTLNLRACKRLIRRRKRLVVGVVAVFAVAGLCLDLFWPPTYRATVRLEIRRSLRAPLNGQNPGSENFQSETASLFTAAQLITNRVLLGSLVDNLDHSAPAIAAAWAPDPPGTVRTPWGAVSLTRALGRAEAAPTAVVASNDPMVIERQVDWLQTIISVQPVKDTRLVDIKVEHHDPLVARAIADRLSRLFVGYQVQRAGNVDPTMTASLDEQIQQVRRRIQAASASMGADVSALPAAQEARTAEMRQALATIGEVQARAHADQLEAGARLSRLHSMSAGSAPVDGQGASAIRQQLSTAQAELAAGRQVYGEEHPKLAELESRVTALQSRLADETRREISRLSVDRSAYAAREAGLQSLAERQMQRLTDLEQKSAMASASSIELRADQDLYGRLIAQAREMKVGGGAGDPSVAIVEPAALEQPDPVRPNRILNLVVCLLAGLLAGGGAALVLESMRRDLSGAAATERALDVPVLAMVPRHA